MSESALAPLSLLASEGDLSDPAAVVGLPFSKPASSIKAPSDRSSEQTDFLLRQWQDASQELEEEDTAWPPPLESIASEYWTKHLSAQAVSVAHFILLGPSAKALKRNAAAAALVANRSRPVRWEVLRSWYARYQMLRLGGVDVGQGFVPPEPGAAPASSRPRVGHSPPPRMPPRGPSRSRSPRSPPPRAPSRGSSRSQSPPRSKSRHPSPSRSPSRSASPKPLCHDGRDRDRDRARVRDRDHDGHALLAGLVSSLTKALDNSSGRPGSASIEGLGVLARSKTEKHLADCQKLVDSGRYPDPVKCSGKYITYLKGKTSEGHYDIGGDMHIVHKGGASSSAKPKPHDPEAVRQGWDCIISMMLKSSNDDVVSKVADRMVFMQDLVTQPLGTFGQKMRFLQEFLDLHGTDDCFSTTWRNDSALIIAYLHDGSKASNGSGYGGGSRRSQSRHQQRRHQQEAQ